MSEETKAFLKTPRGKAIIKLGLYAIFFIFVAVYLRIPAKPSTVEHVKAPLEKYSEMTNYAYQYKYNDISFEGRVYRGKNYFTLNGKEYYIDSKVYLLSSEDVSLEETELDKLYYLDNHDLYNYISNGKVVAKSEDYESKVESIKYSYNDIYVTTNIKDNQIVKVVYEDGENTIEIEYMMVGQVTNPTVKE